MADFGLSRVVGADLTSQHHYSAASAPAEAPRERGLSIHQRTLQPAEAEVRVEGSVDYDQGDLLDAADEAGAGAGMKGLGPRGRPGLPALPTPTHSQRTKVPRTAPEAGPGPGSELGSGLSGSGHEPAAAKAAVPPRVPLTRSLTKHVVGAVFLSEP